MTMTYFVLLVGLALCLIDTVDAHMCKLEKQHDPSTGRERWALRSTERCWCKRVVAPKRIGPSCPVIPDRHGNVEPLWYIDDPRELGLSVNWTPDKLDELLDRAICCKLILLIPLHDSGPDLQLNQGILEGNALSLVE